MTTTERIAAIREALEKVQVVATSTMHKMDCGFVPDPEGETFQAMKAAMALINPAALEAEMSAEQGVIAHTGLAGVVEAGELMRARLVRCAITKDMHPGDIDDINNPVNKWTNATKHLEP